VNRSFADPETHFRLVRSETPYVVDGVGLNAPTGEVECLECGRVAENIDEIPHRHDCPQRFARSAWWADHLRDD
jgi:hypothetical protein